MPSACPTRWWSALGQFKFIQVQNEAIAKLISNDYPGQVNLLLEHCELRMLGRLIPMLDRFKLISELMSVETDVTVSLIKKTVEEIKTTLEKRAIEFALQINGGSISIRDFIKSLAAEFNLIFE